MNPKFDRSIAVKFREQHPQPERLEFDQLTAAINAAFKNLGAVTPTTAIDLGGGLILTSDSIRAVLRNTSLSLDSQTLPTLEASNIFLANMIVGGNSLGGLAVGGTFYNHVLVAIGFGANANPLTQAHQVGIYGALLHNGFVSGAGTFNAAFETAAGTYPGAFTVERIVNYAQGSLTKGSGSTITRAVGMTTVEESAGTHNAAFADDNDSQTFTGNWYLRYIGTRPSLLGGALELDGILTYGGQDIYNTITDGYQRLYGGTVGSPGPAVLVFGPSHVSHANELHLSATAGTIVDGNLVQTIVTLSYGASVATNAAQGNIFIVTATNGTAFTMAAPTNAVVGQQMTFTVRNASGGVLGAVTWDASFKMAIWTSPANGFSQSITFYWSGANFIEMNRTTVDVPN